jgi:NOL1/NOP2/fmu family ribosome biogenesis protein
VASEQIVYRRRRHLDRLEHVSAIDHLHDARNGLELAEIQRDDLMRSHAILLW